MLVAKFRNRNSFTYKQAGKILNSLFEIIHEEVMKGNDIMISPLGTLRIMERKSRRGVNPSTQELMTIPSKVKLRLYESVQLQKSLNHRP